MPQPSEAVVVMAVGSGGGASAVVDLCTRRVPNALTLSITGVGFALAAAHQGAVGIPGAIGGCLIGLLLMLPGHLIGATGAGDVKLLAAFGTLLGPRGVAVAFVYTAIAGGLLAVVVAVRRRRLRDTMERAATLVRTAGANVAEIEGAERDNRFAYAPAIAIGTLVAALGW